MRPITRRAWLVIDVVTCLSALLILFGYLLFRSSSKLFWYDEVLTLVFVRGMSFTEMLAALKEPINAMPPSYFTAVWLWTRAFGTSELALRAFSCLSMACAWVLCWGLLRTFSTRLAAVTATTVVFACSEVIKYQTLEARCYALYLAAFLAAALTFVLSWNRSVSVRLGIAAFCAHFLLVSTHYVGAFYSGALLTAGVVGWSLTRAKPLRNTLIWSIAGAATAAALSVPFYLAQRVLGGKENWIAKPTFDKLMLAFTFDIRVKPIFMIMLAIIVLFLIAIIVTKLARQVAPADEPASRPETPLMGVAFVCLVALLLPIVLWAESLVGLRLFLGRYLLPSIILFPCLLALALDSIAKSLWTHGAQIGGRLGWLARILPAISFGLMLLLALAALPMGPDQEAREETVRDKLAAKILRDRDLDFITSDIFVALPLWHYSGYPIDRIRWVRARPRDGDSHLTMSALDRRFIKGLVLTTETFVAGKGRFLMFKTDKDLQNVLNTSSNPSRIVEDLGDDVVVVER